MSRSRAGGGRRRWKASASLSVLVAGALVLAHGAGVIGASEAARVGVAALGVLYLGAVIVTLNGELDVAEQEGGAWRRWHRSVQPADERDEVTGLAMLVRFSEMSAMDYHVRLRPRIARIAERRLESSGIALADRDRVAAALGPLGPDLVDPELRPPVERDAPGVPATEVRDLLLRLDALA
jgi:hypothetical protein